MKKELLKLIVCPECKSELLLKDEQQIEDNIRSGTLECSSCHRSYSIRDGIPCLLAGKEAKNVQQAFSKQWEYRYKGRFEKEGRVFWLKNSDSVNYLTTKVLKAFEPGEWFLDAGCGSGEKAILLAETFPEINVVAMDFSDTLPIMAKKAAEIPNLHIIQGDVSNPPLKKQNFDKIVSIGVIHHTPDTYKAFKAVSELVTENGSLTLWLYPAYTESPAFQKIYYLIRDIIFLGKGHLLSPGLRLNLLKAFCIPVFLLLPFFLLSKTVNKGLYEDMTIMDLYKGLVFLLYDDLSPQYQHRHKKDEVFKWYKNHGFGNITNPEMGFFSAVKTTQH